MAKRKRSQPKPTPWKTAFRHGLEVGAQLLLKRQTIGLLLAMVGAILFVALLSGDQGTVSAASIAVLRQAFGVGVYPITLLMLGGGLLLLFYETLEHPLTLRWQLIVGLEIIFFAGLGLIHVASPENLEITRRGGYVGWTFRRLMVPTLGPTISALLLAMAIIGGLYLTIGIPWPILLWKARKILAQIGIRWRRAIVTRRALEAREAVASSLEATITIAKRPNPRRPKIKERASYPPEQPPLPSETAKGALPPLELLAPDAKMGDDEIAIRARAQKIEETLASFGIPAKVLEWRCGPTVTQFAVEPGFIERNGRLFKVRVSKILALQNDIALALAAAPIRIEAPVPGRSFVGIEVPNDVKTIVGLRDLLASETFIKKRGPLKLALGRDVSGAPVITDLSKMPHLLIAGATNSGKSVCLNAIIISLLYQHTPETLRLLLIDPKRVELTKYNPLPHLLTPVIVDTHQVVGALRWLIREMESRYKMFAQAGARNLADYNRLARRRQLERLPMIVVIIDELADLMLAAPEDVERALCRLAQMARATGIHLVIATQRPSVDVVTGLIKANFPARISFAVSSQVDSRVILDTPGAERLLGQGDMLFMSPDSAKLERIQGSYVSDAEIDALMAWYRQRYQGEVPSHIEIPLAHTKNPLDEEDPDETLLQQAESLLQGRKYVSASYLQRQLRIGYPRAARLIDQLEERGLVGPKREGGRARQVLISQHELAGEETP